MKVHIGPYIKYWNFYSLVERVASAVTKGNINDDKLYDFTSNVEDKFPIITKFFEWVDSKRTRKVEIRIDNYDTWNADHTAALILVPLLTEFRKNLHSYPTNIDESDLPEFMLYHDKLDQWRYILDRMIEAFRMRSDLEADDIDEREKQKETSKDGLYLFAKYYDHLWD